MLGTAKVAATAVLPALRAAPSCEVVAIASRNTDRAAGFAQQQAIPHVYGDYHALLDDPDVDVVYNPLPNSLHIEWSLAAVRAGKHVLCERPLGSALPMSGHCSRRARAPGYAFRSSSWSRHTRSGVGYERRFS